MSLLKSIAALIILVATNAFVFGGILWNRSGDATGSMVFDQCELDSFTRGGSEGAVRYAFLSFESLAIDEARVEKVHGSGATANADQKWFERRLYVVMKHGGPEWEAFEERAARERGYKFERRDGPQLIFVDGDADPDRLVAMYPTAEGRAILPGFIRPRHLNYDGTARFYWASAASRIAIESQYRDIAKEIRDARLALEEDAIKPGQQYTRPPCTPTHRIIVKWGQRFEPWISTIEAM